MVEDPIFVAAFEFLVPKCRPRYLSEQTFSEDFPIIIPNQRSETLCPSKYVQVYDEMSC